MIGIGLPAVHGGAQVARAGAQVTRAGTRVTPRRRPRSPSVGARGHPRRRPRSTAAAPGSPFGFRHAGIADPAQPRHFTLEYVAWPEEAVVVRAVSRG